MIISPSHCCRWWGKIHAHIQPHITTFNGGGQESDIWRKKKKSSKMVAIVWMSEKSALTLLMDRRRCEVLVTQLTAHVSSRINTELHIIKIQIIGRILKEYW